MYNHKYVTFEVSTMVGIMVGIMVVTFCVLVPYAFLDSCQHFRKIYCLLLHGWKTETAYFTETLEYTYESKWHQNSKHHHQP